MNDDQPKATTYNGKPRATTYNGKRCRVCNGRGILPWPGWGPKDCPCLLCCPEAFKEYDRKRRAPQ